MSERYTLPIPFGWYRVASSEDLAVGQVRPLKYFGKELVLFRTESGEAKVLDAFCPHLGAHLGYGGSVAGESIACPFHGWQFNGNGRCTAVPYAKNMPPKVAGDKSVIHAYPTVEKNQSIWAWYHPQQIAPLFDVVDLPEASSPDWTPLQRYSWTIRTTLQETAENVADAAHFVYTHGAREMPRGEMLVDGHKRSAHYDMVSSVPKADGSIDPDAPPRQGHLDTYASGAGQTWQRFTGFFETLLMGMVVPIDAETLELHFAFTQPKNASAEQRAAAELVVKGIVYQAQQDIPIWEHKVYLETPTLCDGDGPIHQHRKWFSQFYADDAPTPIRAAG